MDPEPEDQSEHEPQPDSGVRLQQLRHAERPWAIEVGATIIGVVIVLSALKPWSWGASSAGSRPLLFRPALPTTDEPAPTPDLTADGLAAAFCLGPYSWRTASLETWRTQPVRVWRAFAPAASASGPTDPAIPV